ncbi:hypothetical protein [Phage ST231]|nr:hypothetical protein [Phage ST231]
MATYFEIESPLFYSKTEKAFDERVGRDMPKRLPAFRVKMLFAATYDSYYDELYHYAVFETREQAEHLLARINQAGGKINLEHWITGGCVAASSLKGGAKESVYVPAIKF